MGEDAKGEGENKLKERTMFKYRSKDPGRPAILSPTVNQDCCIGKGRDYSRRLQEKTQQPRSSRYRSTRGKKPPKKTQNKTK